MSTDCRLISLHLNTLGMDYIKEKRLLVISLKRQSKQSYMQRVLKGWDMSSRTPSSLGDRLEPEL